MSHTYHICWLLHMQISDSYVSKYTSYELMAINNVTQNEVKVLLLYSATQLNQMVSLALYNLTPGRGLTQPWCEPSPWGDQSRQAAYIPCRASTKCLSSLCCQSQFYTLVRWGTHGVHILPKDVTAQLGPVMYHTMEQCWQDVTHPCINRAHDCLTSVIKHKMFAPCCVSPLLYKHFT